MKADFFKGEKNWMTRGGIWVVILLALVRFLVYPLGETLKERKTALSRQQEAYRLRLRLLEQAVQGQKDAEMTAVAGRLYPSGKAVSGIQTEILRSFVKNAEEKGLTVLGFEMPEAIPGKRISEIPVVLRVKGRAESLVSFLQAVEGHERVLILKSLEASATTAEVTAVLGMKALRRET